MTNEEKVQTLQKQLDMTNANYNILNKKYIEANIKIKHLIDGIEMIKHREYSDISQLVIENSDLKKKNREQDEIIKELEKYKSKYVECLDKQLERENATHNCLLQSKTILDNLKKENQQLKKEIKQLKFDCSMYRSVNYLINEFGIDKAREIMFQSEEKLKQSQNSKAIEVLERLRNFYNSDSDSDWIIDCCKLDEYIDNQITELRGKKCC